MYMDRNICEQKFIELCDKGCFHKNVLLVIRTLDIYLEHIHPTSG